MTAPDTPVATTQPPEPKLINPEGTATRQDIIDLFDAIVKLSPPWPAFHKMIRRELIDNMNK